MNARADTTTDICPRFQPGPWAYTGKCNWSRHNDGCCDYCGSMNPDTFMARIEAGTVLLGTTDKSYKAYVRNNGGEGLKQTYRNCPPKSTCTYEDCTHWVTRDHDNQKFYFEHLSIDQRKRFVELFNERKLKFDGDSSFYTPPFFMVRQSIGAA
jgi:hypothetical protein